jgi:hypothetical protein
MPEYKKTTCPYCGKEAVGLFGEQDSSHLAAVIWCCAGHVTVIDLDKELTGKQILHQF